MVKYFIYLCIISLLGCGAHKRDGSIDRVDLKTAIQASGSTLTANEIAIGLRICYAFESKYLQFRQNFVVPLDSSVDTPQDKIFRFKTTSKNCNSDEETQTYINPVVRYSYSGSSGILYFDSNNTTLNYFKTIQTHDQGVLSSLCQQMTRGETPIDVFSIDNNTVAEVTFYESEMIDSFQVRYGKKMDELEADYSPYKVEHYKVLTNNGAGKLYRGLVSSSKRTEICNSSSRESSFEQIYEPN